MNGSGWRIWALLAASALALIAAASTSARTSNGGDSIAIAPPLPLGQTTPSGWSLTGTVNNTGEYGEFWRLQLGAGDRIVIDVATTGGCNESPELAFYAPSVTDFTISQASPATSLSSRSTKSEYVWVTPSAGNWTLFFNQYWDSCRQMSYTFNAIVQLFTTTTLTPPPSLVSARHQIPIRGKLTGVSSGKVLVVVKGPKGFTKIGKVLPIRGGAYTWTFKPRLSGLYHFKVSFPGDARHRPSASRSASVRVG